MGVAATPAPKGLGPQNPTKKLAHLVDLLGQPLSRKTMFGPKPTTLKNGTETLRGLLNPFFNAMIYFFGFLPERQ